MSTIKLPWRGIHQPTKWDVKFFEKKDKATSFTRDGRAGVKVEIKRRVALIDLDLWHSNFNLTPDA